MSTSLSQGGRVAGSRKRIPRRKPRLSKDGDDELQSPIVLALRNVVVSHNKISFYVAGARKGLGAAIVFARQPRSNYHFNHRILNPKECGIRLRYFIFPERH